MNTKTIIEWRSNSESDDWYRYRTDGDMRSDPDLAQQWVASVNRQYGWTKYRVTQREVAPR